MSWKSCLVGSNWCIFILALVVDDWLLVLEAACGSLRDSLWYLSAVVLLDCEHPRFRKFDFIIPIDGI